MNHISVYELKEKIEKNEPFILLDVRHESEWQFNRLPKAIHIELQTLSEKLPSLNPNQEIVVYCHHGVRSAQACQLLLGRGFGMVKNLTGGIDHWSRFIDPTVKIY